MRLTVKFSIETLFIMAVALLFNTGANASTLLEKIDSYRNPSNSYKMTVEIKNSDDNKVSKFEVALKDNNKTLIKTLAPKREVGRNMLMIDENMWVFIPNLKRAVRINMAQKLSGQAAIGDISRMRWAGDYKYEIVPSSNKKEMKLELVASKKGLTYDKITAFVHPKTKKPIRALLKTKSGRVLKKAVYKDFKKVEGREIPHKMVLTDYLNDKKKSTVFIKKIKSAKLPSSLFNQRSLN